MQLLFQDIDNQCLDINIQHQFFQSRQTKFWYCFGRVITKLKGWKKKILLLDDELSHACLHQVPDSRQ